MILKKLTIENFRKTAHFEASFSEPFTLISGTHMGDIIKALGIVTRNRSLVGTAVQSGISEKTVLSLELLVEGRHFIVCARGKPASKEFTYDVTDVESNESVNAIGFFNCIRLCEEEENLTYYKAGSSPGYAERFLYYKDPNAYYKTGEFQRKTNWMGLTHTFRSCLKEYIEHHKERGDKSASAVIKEKISDRRTGTAGNEKTDDFMSFLAVNEFWESFERVRNINHMKWPVFIDARGLQEGEDFDNILEETKRLGRQIIVLNGK